jgi:hypothetical protein
MAELFGGFFLRLYFKDLTAIIGAAGGAGVVGHNLGMALGTFHQCRRGNRGMGIMASGLGNTSSSFW